MSRRRRVLLGLLTLGLVGCVVQMGRVLLWGSERLGWPRTLLTLAGLAAAFFAVARLEAARARRAAERRRALWEQAQDFAREYVRAHQALMSLLDRAPVPRRAEVVEVRDRESEQ